jgi:acetyl esterase/lipase
VGFSLGANLALLALARGGDRVPAGLAAVAAVSPPLDLAACADTIAPPVEPPLPDVFRPQPPGRLPRRQRLRPDLYEAGRELGIQTIREYDEVHHRALRRVCGRRGVLPPVQRGPRLEAPHPSALVLAALDDPMVPGDSVARWPLPASGLVEREMTPTGGHVGFVAPTTARGASGQRSARWPSSRSPGPESDGGRNGSTCNR